MSVWDFLNSTFFVAIVTLTAGLVTYVLYRKRIKDAKRDAANIILLEIQNAERQLKVAKQRMRSESMIVDNGYVMLTESWSKYKYLFVRDFDRDQWDALNAFYNSCKLFDGTVHHKTNSFQKNETVIRANMHRNTADYVKDFVAAGITVPKRRVLIANINAFQDEYLGLPNSLTIYTPQKPTNDAKILLDGIEDNLSQMEIGNTLKRLASKHPYFGTLFGRKPKSV